MKGPPGRRKPDERLSVVIREPVIKSNPKSKVVYKESRPNEFKSIFKKTLKTVDSVGFLIDWSPEDYNNNKERTAKKANLVDNPPSIDDILDAARVPIALRDSVGYVLSTVLSNPDMTPDEFLHILANFAQASLPAPTSSPEGDSVGRSLLLMKTKQQLEEKGETYSQAVKLDRALNIITHLQSVWMPWIEAGVLTTPELLARDPSAYKALSAWRNRDGNDLVKTLGHDIPSRSAIARSNITPDQIKEAGRIHALLQRDRTKGSPSRE